ncbi:carboxypeptidase-like protein [Dinothrombium tinctorium]|uniref:Carboxypeptidase-like protein n=1 Tax=Dinothrombium tinctorium TaxID=1965070 RepID=A0A3S3NB96_9ACAR|nr:carboxypeptidase-like protein [Dinothrombium tinctorium]RWR99297.1 carboxypeptidase-like protein [Dinothrombium tinctorium]RWS01019.1 carboxypeptidase-like protein [Dinothrombium tinctorium]
MLVTESAFQNLQKNNLNITVLNENFQRTIDKEQRQKRAVKSLNSPKNLSSYFDTFPRYKEIKEFILNLVQQNPSLATNEMIGQSYENRPMIILKMGKKLDININQSFGSMLEFMLGNKLLRSAQCL